MSRLGTCCFESWKVLIVPKFPKVKCVEVVEQSNLDRCGMTDWELLRKQVVLCFLLHAFTTLPSSGKNALVYSISFALSVTSCSLWAKANYNKRAVVGAYKNLRNAMMIGLRHLALRQSTLRAVFTELAPRMSRDNVQSSAAFAVPPSVG